MAMPIADPKSDDSSKKPQSGTQKAGSALQSAGKAIGGGLTPGDFVKAEIMHKGGPVTHDGIYRLKMGEHVLTEAEAKNARKHALMASGMKSLAKPADKVKMDHAKSTIRTASKFQATKPAPSNEPPADSKPGTLDAGAVSKINAHSAAVKE